MGYTRVGASAFIDYFGCTLQNYSYRSESGNDVRLKLHHIWSRYHDAWVVGFKCETRKKLRLLIQYATYNPWGSLSRTFWRRIYERSILMPGLWGHHLVWTYDPVEISPANPSFLSQPKCCFFQFSTKLNEVR